MPEGQPFTTLAPAPAATGQAVFSGPVSYPLPSLAQQTQPPAHWRYFLYVRKSSEPDDRQVLSIESQKKELLQIFGNLLIAEIIEEAQSAKAPGRPKFEKMLKRLEKGEAQGIIAWHPDRLARNSVDGGRVIYDLDQGRIKDLKFAGYTFENTPEGKWMLNIIFGQSKYFVDKLSKDVKRGLKEKVERGWRPGVAPIGYLNNLADFKGNRTIIPDPERFDLVRKMWDLMLTGAYTPPQILAIASQEWGLRTVERKNSGGKPLSHGWIYKTFKSYFYCGMFEYSGTLHVGKHQPMVSLEEFWKVQKLLGRNGRPRAKEKKQFAYTGMIRCGECGCMITAEEKTKRYVQSNAVKTYVYYHCTKKKRDMKCSQGCITVEELERQIEAALVPISVSDDFVDWAVKYLRQTFEAAVREVKTQALSVKKALERVESRLDELFDMKFDHRIEERDFARQNAKLLRERVQLERQAADPEVEGRKALELPERTCRFANNLSDRFKLGTLDEKKIIVQTVGSNLLLKDGILALEPVKPFVYFTNSHEKSRWRRSVEDVRTFCASPEAHSFNVPTLPRFDQLE